MTRPDQPDADANAPGYTRRSVLRKGALTGGLLMSPLLLQACGGGGGSTPANTGTGTEVPGVGRRGGTLRVGQPADINTVNPLGSLLMVWVEVQESIFDTLVNHDPKTLKIVPKLARSWEWSKDGKAVTFALQEGVRFHDGRPLTAKDVKATLEYVLEPKNASAYATWLQAVKSVHAVDANTLRLETSRYAAELVPGLAFVQVTSRKKLKKLDDAPPLGSGPFEWKSRRINEAVTLKRNPQYWRAGRPMVDELTFRSIPDPDTRLAALQNAEIDLIYSIEARQIERVKQDASLKLVTAGAVDRPFLFYINTRRPPFDNVKVRQAFSYAIDRSTFVKNFLYGAGVPTSGIFHPDVWAANPAVKDAYPYDLDRAAALLAEAGYPKGKGLEFSLLAPVGLPEYKQLSELVQSAFLELGAEARVEEIELAAWGERITSTYEFDVACDNIRWMSSDPAVGLGYAFLFTPGKANISGIKPSDMPEYTKLLSRAASMQDQAQRKQLYAKAQQLWADYAAGPVVCYRADYHAMRSNVSGFVPDAAHQQEFDGVSVA